MVVHLWQGYRDTLDSLIESFQIIASDSTYLHVNPVAPRHVAHSPDEFIGRTMRDLYPEIEETPLFVTLRRGTLDREAVRAGQSAVCWREMGAAEAAFRQPRAKIPR